MTTSCDPADNWRHLGSGLKGVKWATGHKATRNQIGCAKWATGTQNTNKISLRQIHRYGTWNVQGLIQHQGKLQIIEHEIRCHDVSVLGMSETHCRGNGFFRSSAGNTIYFSGSAGESRNGVALIVSPRIQSAVRDYNAVNNKILHLRIQGSECFVNVIQIYAPTSTAEEEEIENFYGVLEAVLHKIPKRKIRMIMDDFNAEIGKIRNDEHLRHVVDNFGLGKRNERGERLLDFCMQQCLAAMNTFFQHHPRRQYT